MTLISISKEAHEKQLVRVLAIIVALTAGIEISQGLQDSIMPLFIRSTMAVALLVAVFGYVYSNKSIVLCGAGYFVLGSLLIMAPTYWHVGEDIDKVGAFLCHASSVLLMIYAHRASLATT
jgi:hypothetical protein